MGTWIKVAGWDKNDRWMGSCGEIGAQNILSYHLLLVRVLLHVGCAMPMSDQIIFDFQMW